MKRNFANVKDTTIIEIRGTLVIHEGLWQLRRDFGKKDFGNSGSVLEIFEGLWQLRRDFGNLRGGLEI
jgi:putative component of toxin-antitoxin plasmid stabilization module